MYEEFIREKRRHNLETSVSLREKRLLKKGVPFQKIIGFVDFDNLKIRVNKRVLIPRYETQEVANFVVKQIKPNHEVLDLCAGSGYLGLAIKKRTNCKVTMVDISRQAVKQMKINAKRNNLQVEIIKSNLFAKIHKKFDLIVANPPYIPTGEKANIAKSVVSYEPRNALFAKEKGNFFFSKIIGDAPKHLKANGQLVFEISPYNETFVRKRGFTVLKDINKKERIAFKRF